MTANRRRHARKKVVFRVDGADTTGLAWMSLADNISEGGLRLSHPAPVSVGDTLTITFVLQDGQPYRLPARVIRVDETGCALAFLQDLPRVISEDDQYWIDTDVPETDEARQANSPTTRPSQPSQAASLSTREIAECMLARWFGSRQPLSQDLQEALEQIVPALDVQPQEMETEYVTACATQLVDALERLGEPLALSPETLTQVLEQWQERALALYWALQHHAATMSAAIDRTKPQTVLHTYRRLLKQKETVEP